MHHIALLFVAMALLKVPTSYYTVSIRLELESFFSKYQKKRKKNFFDARSANEHHFILIGVLKVNAARTIRI